MNLVLFITCYKCGSIDVDSMNKGRIGECGIGNYSMNAGNHLILVDGIACTWTKTNIIFEGLLS